MQFGGMHGCLLGDGAGGGGADDEEDRGVGALCRGRVDERDPDELDVDDE